MKPGGGGKARGEERGRGLPPRTRGTVVHILCTVAARLKEMGPLYTIDKVLSPPALLPLPHSHDSPFAGQ